MNFKSQPCTNKEQSERLIAIGLKPETSDMMLEFIEGYYYENVKHGTPWRDENIHAWSLHRLIEIAQLHAMHPVGTINGWYDDIIAYLQSCIHLGYIKEEYLNMDIVNARENKNM